MWRRLGEDNRPSAMTLVLVAIAGLVAGTVLFERWQPAEDLLVLNGGQLVAAGLALAPVTALAEPLSTVRFTPSFLLARAYLIVAVSGVGMMI